jgi:putative oxidoreductase
MATQASELSVRSPTNQNIGDIVSLAGRVLISALFLLSGLSKIAAPAATIGYIGSAGLPLPSLGFAIAVVIEIPVSLALVLGHRARLAAALMAVFSIAAAFAFHSNLSDQNQLVHFFKNVAIAGGLLQIVAFGAGRFSLDARSGRLS